MKMRLRLLISALTCLLPTSVLPAQEAAAPADDFTKFERTFPWVVPEKTIADPAARKRGVNYDEAQVKPYELPDVLTLANGEKITSADAWEKRRGELLELCRSEIYGVSPPKPADLKFRVVETDATAFDGRALRKKVAIEFTVGAKPFAFHVHLFVPQPPKRRAGVFLLLDHRGTAVNDPVGQSRSGYFAVERCLAQGFAAAAIASSAEVDPDSPKGNGGVRKMYELHDSRAEEWTWGTIAAWAWGASRAMDYFETDADLDPTKVAVIGHSRSGKTALWAAAQDTRFALACISGSGQNGTSLSKRNFGEDTAVINKAFPHWFTAKYKTYDGREDRLPIDQHQVIALTAPRGFYDCEGSEDYWADPRGAWLAVAAASRVWKLYGKAEPLPETQPKVNEVVRDGRIGWHMHDGGHALMAIDWKHCLDHAHTVFRRDPE